MKHGDYSVRIVGGRENASGHVFLKDEQEYKICLRNYDLLRRCVAEIIIDGKSVGNFVIDAGRSMTIERPADVSRKLTFLSVQTAKSEGVEVVSPNLQGLIQVIFTPEETNFYTKHSVPYTFSSNLDLNPEPYLKVVPQETSFSNNTADVGGVSRGSSLCSVAGAGVTGLGASSNQDFSPTNVGKLIYDEAITINLRLVEDTNKKYTSIRNYSNSTPVPPPVE